MLLHYSNVLGYLLVWLEAVTELGTLREGM